MENLVFKKSKNWLLTSDRSSQFLLYNGSMEVKLYPDGRYVIEGKEFPATEESLQSFQEIIR